MVGAKRAHKAETPKQPSFCLRSRAPYFYPTTKTHGTHWREGEAGHNVLSDRKMSDTKRSALISTQLRQIAEQAIDHPERVFTTLIHCVDVDLLR